MTDKELAFEAYWQGYQTGYGVEVTTDLDKKTAKTQFERWWEINHDG